MQNFTRDFAANKNAPSALQAQINSINAEIARLVVEKEVLTKSILAHQEEKKQFETEKKQFEEEKKQFEEEKKQFETEKKQFETEKKNGCNNILSSQPTGFQIKEVNFSKFNK